MTYIRVVAAMILGLGVSACASVDTASRNASFDETAAIVAPAPSYVLAGFDVSVPDTLIVSESNSYYPGGDIVWRGEGYGNRREQVKAIFDDSIQLGAGPLNGAMPVQVNIEVTRFHALTEKTRYSIGGVHSLEFTMTIIEPISGTILRGPKPISASLVGYGGQRALDAEAKGLTQKYRITQHLAFVVREELTKVEGYVPLKRGPSAAIRPLAPIAQGVTAQQG